MKTPKLDKLPLPGKLPMFPTRDDELKRYKIKVEQFLDAMPVFVDQVNELIDYLNKGEK